MMLNDIKIDFVVKLTKFFLEKYRDGEVKNLDAVVRNVIAISGCVGDMAYTFDESIWPPSHPEWEKNLIDFRVRLNGQCIGYYPFRLFVNKDSDQTPIFLNGETFLWDWTI